MSMESRFTCFKTKHNLDDCAMEELLILFNDSFIELAHRLLENSPNTPSPTVKNSKPISSGVKKWATKIAAEYASENNLTLDDFDKEKITKKDIDLYLKEGKTASKKIPQIRSNKEETKDVKWYEAGSGKSKKESHGKCCGMNKSGDPCLKEGTVNPENSKNYYCFRHAVDWKNFEVSSDSDLEVEELEGTKVCTDEETCKRLDPANLSSRF